VTGFVGLAILGGANGQDQGNRKMLPGKPGKPFAAAFLLMAIC